MSHQPGLPAPSDEAALREAGGCSKRAFMERLVRIVGLFGSITTAVRTFMRDCRPMITEHRCLCEDLTYIKVL